MGLLGLTGIFLIVLITTICLIPAVFFMLTMQKTLQKCAPKNRTMMSGSAWLLLIPLLNVVWDFILVSQMAAPPVLARAPV